MSPLFAHRALFFSLFLSLWVVKTGNANPHNDWEFVPKYSKGGIIVHQRKVESKLFEVNGSGMIDAPMTTVLHAVNDNEHRQAWMKSSLSAKIIADFPQKEHTSIFYNGVDVPWPFHDRFFYVTLTVKCDPLRFRDKYRIQEEFIQKNQCTRLPASPLSTPKQVSLEFSSDPSLNDPIKYKIPDGTVRVTSIHGHWYFYPMICDGREQTFLEYQVYADFAGHIPLWLVNREAVGIPAEIIRELGAYVKSNRAKYDDFQTLKETYPYMFQTCIEK